MTEITTLKELKQAIKNAKAVYVSTMISKHDSTYVQVVKADILSQMTGWDKYIVLTFCRVDSHNNLFIN